MRAGTKVREIPLFIEADNGILRQIFNQLHFIRLILFLHKCNGFLSRKFKTFDGRILLNDLLHFLFNGI